MQTLSVDRLVGQVLGNYRVEQLLGRGRLNAVFLARNVATQSQGALTLFTIPENFSSEARTRFLRRFHKASAALVALRHEHILPVYEGGEYLGYPYLVTPYMMNGSLTDIVKRKGRLSHERVRDMLEQIVAGLEYAHKKGIIHGTLKPSNIVLSTKQTMLVAGFGLMHIQQMRGVERSDQPYGHLMSVANTLLVAPEYIAPEIVEGQYIDKRSDVYALGAILFELLSGRPPFTGSDALAVIKQHVEQNIPSLRSLCSDVPVALESVVNQALERDPARRFQSASELAEAFDQVSRGATGPLYNLSGKTRPSSSRPSEQFLQEVSEENVTSSTAGKNWQFTPPIVTGKVPAFKPAAKQERPPAASTPSRPRTRETERRSGPPRIAAEQIPATGSTTRSSSRGVQKQMPAAEGQEIWSDPGIVQTEDIQFSAPLPAMPPQARKVETTEDIRFSAPLPAMQQRKVEQREEDTEPPVRSPRSQSRRNEEDNWWQQSQSLQMPTEIDDLWSPVPMTGTLKNTRSLQGKKPARGTSRRSVVALLAAGGVAAAVGFVAVNNSRLMQMASGVMQQANTPTAAKTGSTTNTGNQGGQPGKTPAGGTQQQNGGKTANVIGTTTLATNSSAVFTNPGDKKDSVLVHLNNGNFVAYERACTHVGVNVNYDPATQLLVCPAHGAIFDPAKGAAVVQGPNGDAPTSIKPLAKVPIQVKSDGTITTV